MRIALFASALSTGLATIPQTVKAEAPTAKVLTRNPKYFTADTLKDSFAAVVVAYDAPNASAIAEGFAAKQVPVFVVDAEGVAMRFGVDSAQTLGEFLTAQREPSDTAAVSSVTTAAGVTTVHTGPANPTTDPGNSAGDLSKMHAKDLRELAKSLNVPFVGKRREDIEAGIRAAQAKAADTPSSGENSGDPDTGDGSGTGDENPAANDPSSAGTPPAAE